MQLLKFFEAHWAEIMAIYGTGSVLIGAVGTLLTKLDNPVAISIGHRLEAIGTDARKLISGKSRTTESKPAEPQ